MGWAAAELSRIDLGDQRLNERSVKLLRRLSAKPSASIPAACQGWAETVAAYRFLAQDDMAWRDLLQPPVDCSLARRRNQPVVLGIQDTTALDFNGRGTEGLGPLSYEAQRGMYLHPTYVVTPERVPLGVLDAWMWAREAKDERGERPGLLESLRGIEGYERIAERAADLPDTRRVSVADREADILALMQRAHALGNPVDWLLRSQHHRKLGSEDGQLWELAAGEPVLGEIGFHRPPRPGRKGRNVVQQVRVLRVSLPADGGGKFQVTVIVAREINPPPGEKPLEWRLLSNREATTLAEAAE